MEIRKATYWKRGPWTVEGALVAARHCEQSEPAQTRGLLARLNRAASTPARCARTLQCGHSRPLQSVARARD
jgi:hypothetical protein